MLLDKKSMIKSGGSAMSLLYSAENRIENLKQRSKRCVCSYCGNALTLRRIIFNDIEEARVEIFCDNCNRIEFGVEPEIYTSAVNFIDNLEFNYFETLDQNEKTRKMNIAKICEILAWGCKNMGLMTRDGFCVPVNMSQNSWAECLIMESKDINENKTFEEMVEEIACKQS